MSYRKDRVQRHYFKYNDTYCVMFNSYDRRWLTFQQLIKFAMADGLEIIPETVRLEMYGGDRFKRMMGIEFQTKNPLPHPDYFVWENNCDWFCTI